MTDLKIYNAPAGSGKSTEIKARVREWSSANPYSRMLCVTYTNRAADELQSGISAPNVEVSTIHSFLARFMEPAFSLPAVVSLFVETYATDIRNRIANVGAKEHIDVSNARYEAELGSPLTFELIVESIKRLKYNERPSNTLYKGGLSHDDLLSFANACSKKFPGLLKKLGSTYQQIVIDEYQDTNVEALELFTTAAERSGTPLHLYGDPMQQIYQLSSERYRSVLSKFDIDKREVTNFRSTETIVLALNGIYNDPGIIQKANNTSDAERPQVHLTADVEATRAKIVAPETLILSVKNSTIFDNIGAKELFAAINQMPAHSFNSMHPAKDILTGLDWRDNNNPIIRLLYGLLQIESLCERGRVGEVIQILRKHESAFGVRSVDTHADKERVATELGKIFELLKRQDVAIQTVLEGLTELGYVKRSFLAEYVQDEHYGALLQVPFTQVRNMFQFNLKPGWSTQHGVKGEGHEKVVFIAEDIGYPVSVKIYTLLNLWPDIEFSLELLEDAYSKISQEFEGARALAAGYFEKPNKDTYDKHRHLVDQAANTVAKNCSGTPLFDAVYGPSLEKYFAKAQTTNASKLFNIREMEGLLAAYRLFYVGCSRAKMQLDVIVDSSKIDDTKRFSRVFEGLGFQVTNHD